MSTHPSFRKQVAGAAIGALMAVGLYHVYSSTAPALRAYIVPPGITPGEEPKGTVRLADTELTDREERLQARAEEAVKRMKQFHKDGTVLTRKGTVATTSSTHSTTTAASSAAAMIMPVQPVSMSQRSTPSSVASVSSTSPMTIATSTPGALPSSGPALLVAAGGAFVGASWSFMRRTVCRISHTA